VALPSGFDLRYLASKLGIHHTVDDVTGDRPPSQPQAQTYVILRAKCPLSLYAFQQNWNVAASKNSLLSDLMKVLSAVLNSLRTDGQTDRYSEVNRHLFAVFSYKHVS
jgi:hypothetical protein